MKITLAVLVLSRRKKTHMGCACYCFEQSDVTYHKTISVMMSGVRKAIGHTISENSTFFFSTYAQIYIHIDSNFVFHHIIRKNNMFW